MAEKPPGEIAITPELIRGLLRCEPPGFDTEHLPLRKVAEGWDNEVWRLGDEWALRLPRRPLAVPLLEHEQRWLPVLTPTLAAAGIRIPLPLLAGRPQTDFPYPWSVVPWLPGKNGLELPRTERGHWTDPLARALAALHVVAPADAPPNAYRGVPLARRDRDFRDRRDAVTAAGVLDEALAHTLTDAWDAGLAASPYRGDPVWIHGDLHPGNLVADDGGSLCGILDFGDLTAGDPAYDLAIAWLAFDERGRADFIRATGRRYDAHTWTRARAWAAAVAVMLLRHSDDDPVYRALGHEATQELAR